MTTVRPLLESDADAVASRVEDQLRRDAERIAFVNPELDKTGLAESLRRTVDPAWVAEESGSLTGHLYGALLTDQSTLSVWTGPDGCSFDHREVLTRLLERAHAQWRERGAMEHFAWCVSELARIREWTEHGYHVFSVRGVVRLDDRAPRTMPDDYLLRRGHVDDVDRAVELDAVLDAAQGTDVGSLTRAQRDANRQDLLATLDDPETHHYVVEHRQRVIAQCVTFAAPTLRGSFPGTVHLSEVVVEPRHQRRGVASAMVDAAFADAVAHGFRFAETQWRVSNLGATLYWTSHGFQPTYARLRRAL